MDYFLARRVQMSGVMAEVPVGSATCCDVLTVRHTFTWDGFTIG